MTPSAELSDILMIRIVHRFPGPATAPRSWPTCSAFPTCVGPMPTRAVVRPVAMALDR